MSERRTPKQIGIPFQGDMVRAILEDRKTLTSRLRGLGEIYLEPDKWKWIGNVGCHHSFADKRGMVFIVKCPYGQPGDILIVRETWARPEYASKTLFRADYDSPLYEDEDCTRPVKWKSAMLMPWALSRLRLEVVKVWPSRLQDMTEEMAKQEGMLYHDGGEIGHSGWRHSPDFGFVSSTATDAYRVLWDRINGKTHPWESNPWVWRVEFKRL